jgi:hypothetical protein
MQKTGTTSIHCLGYLQEQMGGELVLRAQAKPS